MYKKVDWPAVISILQRNGMTHEQQALEIQCSRRNIGKYLTGSEPVYSKGERLLDVFISVVGSTAIPRV